MKLVILDRDGVINHDSLNYIRSAKDWQPIDGSLEAIARLTHDDYRVAVASNQAGIACGLLDYDDLFAIHDKMTRMAAEFGGRIDGIFFCPHESADRCGCRKPATGLFDDIARRWQVELAGVPVIGDSWRDLQAARAAGAWPMLVRTGNGADTEREHREELADTPVYGDLAAAVSALAGNSVRLVR